MKRQKIIHSIRASIEWRVFAFLLTGAFLWATGGNFLSALQTAFMLQIVLLAGHSTWLYFRSGYTPPQHA